MDVASPPRRALRVANVRAANRAAVLRLLRRHHQLSRVELARRTGLSEAAVSRIIGELMEEGLLVEPGGEHSTGGRPGIRLQLNETRFCAIGVEIRNWETRVSLGTVSGRILDNERFRTPSTPEKTLDRIAASIERLAGTLAVPLTGVGVSARGLVNSETGVAEVGNDPAWVHVAIADYLAKRVGGAIFVENNVRAAALAEYVCGTPEIQGTHCLLFVGVDEGVGMGMVLDGRLYHGPRMAAGEIGQMVIAAKPGPERHNRPGCLEMLASDPVTCERYARLAEVKSRSGSNNSAEQVRQICHLAMEGEAAARQAVAETATYLGIGIANAVWTLDADAVVLDGALAEAWPLVSAAIREQFPEGPQFLNFRNLTLRPSALGGEASIIGAITLPFTPLFSSEGVVRS
jgi:predicted NBD/HSP70 family sugar kinase